MQALVSGGSGGVVSPHVVMIQRGQATVGKGEGLVAGFAGGTVEAAQLGGVEQAQATEAQVRAAMAAVGAAIALGEVDAAVVTAGSAPSIA